MPVIRIADIPNAGPQAVSASSANINVPQFGGFAVNPQAAQLTGAASMSDASVRRGAQSMLTESLELDAYTAEAEAGVRTAKQIGSLGYVAEQMAERFGKAKDTADLSRAETTMRAAFEKQQTEQLDLPVDKWEENWQRNLEMTRKALSEIKLSNNAAGELAPGWERWSQLSVLQIQNQSRKKQVEGFQMDVDANAMMKVAGDDFAGAFSIYDRAEKDGIFTPEENKMRKARLYDDQIRQAKEDNLSRLVGQVNSTPQEMIPLLERRSRGEEVRELGDITPVQATTLASNAQGILRSQLADQDDAADQAVLTGEIRSAEDLRKQFPDLPERRLLQHEATLNQIFENSPERWAQVAAMRPRLLTEIENYNGAKDPEWQQLFQLKDKIKREMPPGERQEFLELLTSRRREGSKVPAAVRDAMSTLSTMHDKGYFGVADPARLASTNDAKREAELNKMLEAAAKHTQMRSDLEEWGKENPSKAKDPEQVREFLRRSLKPETTQKAIDLYNNAVEQSELDQAADAVLNFGGLNLGGAALSAAAGIPAFNVTTQTRDQAGTRSVAGARQVALDFNDASSAARGVEIVIPANATEQERGAAQAYTDELAAWFQSKGVDVPNRGVKTVTGAGKKVSRFHTEPFFAKDQAAREAIMADAKAAAERGEPSEYAQLLVRTLGRVPGINFIAPHESGSAAGAVSGDYNERDFARKYIIPSLELIKRQGMMSAN